MRKIGLFGGTFDPIHIGHIAVAMQVKLQFHLDKIIFIPSGQPPHKNIPEASRRDRYEMVQIAILNHNNFECSKTEIEREGFSYAIDTVKYFKDNDYKNDELYYITGIDIMESFLDWKDPYALLNSCNFIIVARPGYSFDNLKNGLLGKVFEEYKTKINLIEIKESDISATQIRKLLKEGDSISGFVPHIIEEYIKKKGLYN